MQTTLRAMTQKTQVGRNILSVPVTPALRTFIDDRVRARGFSTVSEYVRALIHADQERAAQESLEAKLLAAVERGDLEDADPAIWEAFRRQGKADLVTRPSRKGP